METKITNILEDYDITAPERTVCKQVCQVINKELNTDISVKDVRYQQGTIWLDIPPLVRSQVHLNKEDIRKKISDKIKNRNISDLH